MENTNVEQDKYFSLDVDTVTLFLDDDEEVTCQIVTLMRMGSKEYIALIPMDENGELEDCDAWIYEFKADPTGGKDHEILTIMDDEEFEVAEDLYYEWYDTQEFLSMED